ncbi:hypothetical protein LT337_27680 [Mycolicibacterium fortuitum]|nr:hypothetical protein LT337_27680 [Mycolicibacterium fortuitum]
MTRSPVVQVVGAGLAAVEVRGGIHSVTPSVGRFLVVQPAVSTMRLFGPHANVRSLMSVRPPSFQSWLA